MALFLTISEGRTGEPTHPILASSDPRILAAVLAAIERRMSLPPPAVPLRPVRFRRAPLHASEDDKRPR
jgi:hypothetical protein